MMFQVGSSPETHPTGRSSLSGLAVDDVSQRSTALRRLALGCLACKHRIVKPTGSLNPKLMTDGLHRCSGEFSTMVTAQAPPLQSNSAWPMELCNRNRS